MTDNFFNCNASLLLPGDRVLIGEKKGTVVRKKLVEREPKELSLRVSLTFMPLHPDDTIEPITLLLKQASTVKCLYDDPTSTAWIEG